MDVFNFNTFDTIMQLGGASSDISEIVLRQIERTVKDIHIMKSRLFYGGDTDGDSAVCNNWTDVLTEFAVKYMGENVEVITITPEKVDELRNVFNEMNKLSTRTETVSEETTAMGDDSEEETVTHTTLIIYVKVSSMTYEEGAAPLLMMRSANLHHLNIGGFFLKLKLNSLHRQRPVVYLVLSAYVPKTTLKCTKKEPPISGQPLFCFG